MELHDHFRADDRGRSTEDAGTTARPPFRFRRGAKAFVAATDSALLVRERHAGGGTFWTLPGGGLHPGESSVAALERELSEELRCRCVVGNPVDAFLYAHRSSPRTISAYAVHECRLLSDPDPAAVEGILDVRWASPRSLPERTLPQVRRIVRHGLRG